MATINHKTYNEATETFKDFNVYDGKETLIFKVDGSEGNVGIGTSTPSTELDVAGTITAYRYQAISSSASLVGYGVGTGLGMFNAGTDTLGFATASTERMRLDDTILQLTTAAPNQGIIQLSNSSSYQIRGGGNYGYISLVAPILRFDANGSEAMRITSAGLVGIGTSSPTTSLDVIGSGRFKSSFGDYLLTIENIKDDSQGLLVRASDNDSTPLVKFQSSVGATSETWIDRFVVNKDGNVGIGTSAPGVKLDVAETLRVINTGESVFYLNNSVVQHQIAITADPSNKLAFRWNGTEGMALTPFGLTFNGDTAAANALDDYEEGTWTPSLAGCTFSGTITGNYTKIGRQVFIQMQFINATISGASGAAEINGLPFTSASGPHNAISITYADSLPSGDSGYVGNNATVISMRSGTGASSTTWINGTNNKSIMLTASYFV
jgi:hypothetical protein